MPAVPLIILSPAAARATTAPLQTDRPGVRPASRRVAEPNTCGTAEAGGANADAREPIDAVEVYEHVRDIIDPEHPYTLEQLRVVEEELVEVDDAAGAVRWV